MRLVTCNRYYREVNNESYQVTEGLEQEQEQEQGQEQEQDAYNKLIEG